MYQATRDVSKVILWTSLVDPASADELQSQFANSDRVVLWGIVGFGVVLILSISAVGILITHKVAGPLYKIASFFGRVRDNRLGPTPANLRKGDELQEFYGAFKEMHTSLRARAEDDVRLIGNAVSVLGRRGPTRALTRDRARARRAAASCANARKRASRSPSTTRAASSGRRLSGAGVFSSARAQRS